MKPLLALVGIFKNEAASMRALLSSVKDVVDRWTIIDTGSIDGTQDIIMELLGSELAPPGRLHQEPFTDFSATRNRALELAALDPNGPAEFTIFLSGDETLHDGAALRAFLETQRDAPDGAYNVELRADSTRWEYTRVLRTGAGWKYVRPVHEVPVGPKGEGTGPLIPGCHIEHKVTDPARRARRIREFDLPTLRKIVEDPALSDDEKAGDMFFLADTHTSIAAEIAQAAGALDKLPPGSEYLSHQYAAMALYWRCGQLMERRDSPIFDVDKARLAQFFYYHVAEKAGVYFSSELVPRLEVLAKATKIPEVHYMLAQHAAQTDARAGLFHATRAAKLAAAAREKPGHLPTDLRIEYMALTIAAVCAQALKNKPQAKELAKKAVAAGAPAEMMRDF